jgi:asparagine synthase (glutamine-hydrolysing)
LGIRWEFVPLIPPTGRDVLQYFRLKGGIINCSGAADVQFMREVERKFACEIVYFSGDGGDKLLPNLKPARRFDSDAALARYTIDRNALASLELVEQLTGISFDEIEYELAALYDSYPEQDRGQKYVRFMIYERAMRWLFEGEDHNRCRFWSCTPFYSLPFFTRAMSCTSRMKRGHALYAEFFRRLSPQTAGIVDAGRGTPLTTRGYRWKLLAISQAARYPSLQRWLKNVARKPVALGTDSALLQCLRAQAEHAVAIGDYLDVPAIRKVANGEVRAGRETVANLITLATFLETLSGGATTIGALSDMPFA